MPTKKEWETIIQGRGGKIGGGCVSGSAAAIWEFIDGNWFYYNPRDAPKQEVRNAVAREMRKDGWEVKTETNTLGYFIHAKRRKK